MAIVSLPLLLCAAPVKLALLGERSLCDQAMVELSGNDSFELLERSEIDKVMREHQLSSSNLSAGVLKRHFPHTDLYALIFRIGKEQPFRFRVFNAKNGYLLADRFLPEQIPEKMLAELLASAAEKLSGTGAKPVALGVVRRVAGAEKEATASLVFTLTEGLINTPGIQLLERGHLGAVLNERELSGMTLPLAPSTVLIHLEVMPGADKKTLNVDFSLSDAAGKIFAREKVAVSNHLELYQAVCRRLDATPREFPGDRKAEAVQYFREFREFLQLNRYAVNALSPVYNEAASLIDAALALDPENPQYQYDKIFYELAKIHGRSSGKEKLELLRRYIRDANTFIDRFPDFRYPVYSGGFHRHPANDVQPLNGWNLRRFTESEIVELASLIPEIKEIDRRCRNGNSDWFLDDPAEIKTVRDLEKFRETRRSRLDLSPEIDAFRMVRDRYQTDIDIFNVTNEFIRRHPAQQAAAGKQYYYSYFPFSWELPSYLQTEAWDEIRRILNEEWDMLEKLYSGAENAAPHGRLNDLTALREYLNSDHSFAMLKQTFDNALKRGGPNRKYQPRTLYFHYLRSAAVHYGLNSGQVNDFMLKRPASFMAEQAGLSDTERAEALIASGAPVSELLNHASAIRGLALRAIQRNDSGGVSGRLIDSLYFRRKENPEAQKLLTALNDAFEVREFPSPHPFCLAAGTDGEQVYLLCASDQRELYLYRFEPAMGTYVSLPAPKLTSYTFQYDQAAFDQFNFSTISVTGGKIIFGGDRQMLIYDPAANRTEYLKELPGGLIASAAIIGERIVYLCGGREKTDRPGLYSCLKDGSDAKVYFAGDRLNKENELDKLRTARMSEFIPLSDGRLLFAVYQSSEYGKIWSFDPATETLSPVAGLEDILAVDLRDQGDFILGQAGRKFGETWFRMDKKTLRPEWLMTQNKNDASRPYRCKIDGYYSMQSPALLLNNRLLISAGRFGNFVLDLETPEKSPLLCLPEAADILYLPKTQEFVVPVRRGTSSLFILKLKESGQ